MTAQQEDLQAYFSLLDFMLCRYLEDGRVEIAKKPPAWVKRLAYPPTQTRFSLTEHFPFLDCFLPDALPHWQKKTTGLIRSGVWDEHTKDEQGILLEAIAGNVKGQAVLFIGPRATELTERQETLQKVRQLHLDHEVLEKAQNALKIAEAKQRAILKGIPDTYVLFGLDGKVAGHNAENFPSPEKQPLGLRLADMLGHDITTLFLEQAKTMLNTGEPVTFEYQRVVGEVTASKETRLVPLGEDLVLAVVRDITDRKEMEHRQQEFLSVASHELRTPLTSINGALAMIPLLQADLETEAKELIEIAKGSSDRLIRLVTDLLDVQRLELNARELELYEIKLWRLVELVIAENLGFADKHNVQLVAKDGSFDPTVCVESNAMIQVLTNLVSNAIKFSPEGGTVTMTVDQEGPWAVCRVSDQGPGIEEKYHHKIFSKFAMLPQPKETLVKGSGLGLSICKALVDRHQGHIGFESEMGVGTTFFVKLACVDET